MLRKKKIDTFSEAMDFAYKKLAIADRSSQEILANLAKRNCPGDIAQAVLDYLLKNNYINDERLCESICERWKKSETSGKNSLKAKLFKRGLAKNTINEALALDDFDETEKADKTLTNYLKLHQVTDPKSLAKLLRHMSAKGFSYTTIKRVVSGKLKISLEQ